MSNSEEVKKAILAHIDLTHMAKLQSIQEYLATKNIRASLVQVSSMYQQIQNEQKQQTQVTSMTPKQTDLVCRILARLEPYFAADDIRPCKFCGRFVRVDPAKGVVVEHNQDCVVILIRELKKTLD